MIQVLIINSHSLEDLVGFLHYLIEDERNDFIWLDLKVDISVTSSLFLSLSGLSECLSQPQKSDLRPHFFTLSTVFLNFRPSAQTNLTALGLQENILVRENILVEENISIEENLSLPGLDGSTVIWADTVGHLVRFDGAAAIGLDVVISVLLLPAVSVLVTRLPRLQVPASLPGL